jgi:hypothetical protein
MLMRFKVKDLLISEVSPGPLLGYEPSTKCKENNRTKRDCVEKEGAYKTKAPCLKGSKTETPCAGNSATDVRCAGSGTYCPCFYGDTHLCWDAATNEQCFKDGSDDDTKYACLHGNQPNSTDKPCSADSKSKFECSRGYQEEDTIHACLIKPSTERWCDISSATRDPCKAYDTKFKECHNDEKTEYHGWRTGAETPYLQGGELPAWPDPTPLDLPLADVRARDALAVLRADLQAALGLVEARQRELDRASVPKTTEEADELERKLELALAEVRNLKDKLAGGTRPRPKRGG